MQKDPIENDLERFLFVNRSSICIRHFESFLKIVSIIGINIKGENPMLTSVEYNISWIFFRVSSLPSPSPSSCVCTRISMSRSWWLPSEWKKIGNWFDWLSRSKSPFLSLGLPGEFAFLLIDFAVDVQLRSAVSIQLCFPRESYPRIWDQHPDYYYRCCYFVQ